jgi:hypothetical protein
MRRLAIVVVALCAIIGLAAYLPGAASAQEDFPHLAETPEVILLPQEGDSVQGWDYFEAMWTSYPDALWYRVQVFLPQDAPEWEFDPPEASQWEFIEFRYDPDTYIDIQRRDPRMKIDAGLLVDGYDHQIVVTPMGATEELLAEYGEHPPTGLPLENYVALSAPSEPVTFHVQRLPGH